MADLFHRVSIRKYQEKKVEPEKLDYILRASMAAPSACNQQPWEFYIVEEDQAKLINDSMEEYAARKLAKQKYKSMLQPIRG